MPVFARDVRHGGGGGYGVLMAAVGGGAMLGALAIAGFSRRVSKGPMLLTGGTAFGLLVAAFTVSRWFAVSVALLAVAGCAMIVNNALTNTLLQTLVPDQLRGRVMGFYSFVFVGLAPLGAFQAGVFAERFGAPLAVGAGAVICALAIAMAAWRVPGPRRAGIRVFGCGVRLGAFPPHPPIPIPKTQPIPSSSPRLRPQPHRR